MFLHFFNFLYLGRITHALLEASHDILRHVDLLVDVVHLECKKQRKGFRLCNVQLLDQLVHGALFIHSQLRLRQLVVQLSERVLYFFASP